MKKVTIPTCANPFVVIVNGMKYTYPAGETVEVPDDVAAVIEQHHDAHNNPQPEPATPPYSSGAKSWNDLEDKPFYDETVTIEWDGDSTGKAVIDLGNDARCVKVSELTPEPTELIGGIVRAESAGNSTSVTITEDMFDDARSQGLPAVTITINEATPVMIVYEPYPDYGMMEAGIYFVDVGILLRTTSLTYGSIKKLDPKFLPEGVGGGLPHISIEIKRTTNTETGDSVFSDVNLTDEQCAMLDNAAAANIPIIVSADIGYYTVLDGGTEVLETNGLFSTVGVFVKQRYATYDVFSYNVDAIDHTIVFMKNSSDNKWFVGVV